MKARWKGSKRCTRKVAAFVFGLDIYFSDVIQFRNF